MNTLETLTAISFASLAIGAGWIVVILRSRHGGRYTNPVPAWLFFGGVAALSLCTVTWIGRVLP